MLSSDDQTDSIWPYQNGQQVANGIEHPKPNTNLGKILANNKMIEIRVVIKKKNKTISAFCHSCKILYESTNVQQLGVHVLSKAHQRRLTMPSSSTSAPKEYARRMRILDNKKFENFLEMVNEKLHCKWCNEQLADDSSKINSHRWTKKHLASMNSCKIDIHNSERLVKIKAIVAEFSADIAMVTSFDKKVNDEYMEHYLLPSKQKLHLNDLYCKLCRIKFDRTNPSRYREAVREHLQSKQHDSASRYQAQKLVASKIREKSGLQTKPGRFRLNFSKDCQEFK